MMDAGANELKTLDELRHDMLNIMANCSYQKIQKYKAFIEQNDQRIGQMVKQITKLVELFREFRRFFQNKREIGESISEPIRNISALAQNMELNVMLEKFADLNKILFENSNNFLEKFLEITLSPLDQLIKSFNSAEIEICKKNVDKAFRAYEAKFANGSKKRKSVDLSNMASLTDEVPIENSNLTHRLCEYLTLMNKSKTSSLNLFSNALVDFYKTQMSFYKSSLDQLSSFMSKFDQRKISTSLVSFNLNQSEEKQLLKDVSINLAQLPKPKHHRTPSNFFNLNEKFSSFHNSSNLSSSVTNLAKVSSDSKKSDVSLNISQISNMSMSSFDLRINPNPQSSNEKIGFLFKRTHNSKVRKHWIKRRCKAVSGHFFIYHSDETLEPVKLSLITCIVKPVDSTRFKIFSGSNSRIYEFMCEYEADFAEWISILNTAKNSAFEKEMSDNISLSTITNATTNNSSESNSSTLKNEKDNERACELIVKNMLRHLLKVKGNDRCADCEAPDPDWLVTNLGVFVCIECCGIHREMGVQVSKTQSIKIDRLNTHQLIIAKTVGNEKLNSIFEESLDKSQKLKNNSTMDLRQKYLKSKYEHHLFARQQFGDEALGLFVENLKLNNLPNSIDFLLKIFVNNIDMFQPVPQDSKLRNILLLILEHFEEFITLPITEFLVQNRDFPKNKNKIDYQDIDGNSAVHYCALYNRIDSIKLLLKSNASVHLKNKAGLTALEIADNLTNFECAEQISLFVQGKPLAKIDWMVWFEKETEEYTENSKLESAVIDKTTTDRPLSLIIGSNKNIGCSKTKKLHNNRHHSESFNVVNIEKYYNQKRAKNLSILPPVPFEKIKYHEYEHRSMDNLDKSCYLNQNEVAKKTSKRNNNRYTAIIDCVSFESIDTEVAKQSNESRLSEEKFYSKL